MFAGDFYQLPPVPDAGLKSSFAFESRAWKSIISSRGPDMNCYFLRKVHRQGDPRFRELLNRMRVGQSTPDDIQLLKQCQRPIKYEDGIQAIRLFAHRTSVMKQNESFLNTLPGDVVELPALDQLDRRLVSAIRVGRRRWIDADKLRAYADK